MGLITKTKGDLFHERESEYVILKRGVTLQEAERLVLLLEMEGGVYRDFGLFHSRPWQPQRRSKEVAQAQPRAVHCHRKFY